MNKEFSDRAPEEQPGCEGDLAYGRYLGTNPSRGDYPANRDKDGVPQNKPICKVIHVQPRDPRYWGGKGARKVVKSIVNDSAFQNTVLKIVVKNLNRLKFNLGALRVGADRLTP